MGDRLARQKCEAALKIRQADPVLLVARALLEELGPLDIVDKWLREDATPIRQSLKSCKFCGFQGLAWGRFRGKDREIRWRLFVLGWDDGQLVTAYPHSCREYDREADFRYLMILLPSPQREKLQSAMSAACRLTSPGLVVVKTSSSRIEEQLSKIPPQTDVGMPRPGLH